MTPHRILITGRNDRFPQLSTTPSRGLTNRGHLAPSVSAMLSEGASPTYDATEERWIVPPSGRMLDAGAAAELRQPRLHRQRLGSNADAGPVLSPEGTRRLIRQVGDALTVLAGLVVFGAIAWFFLVLA